MILNDNGYLCSDDINFYTCFWNYFLLYKREKNIQKKATPSTIGRVIRHSYWNNSDLAALPVVEYEVDGRIYEKRLSYSTFETTTSKKATADILDTKYIRSPYHVLNLEKYFQWVLKCQCGTTLRNLSRDLLRDTQGMIEY